MLTGTFPALRVHAQSSAIRFNRASQSLLLRLPAWQNQPDNLDLEKLLDYALQRPMSLPELATLDLDFLLFATCETTGRITIAAGPRDSLQWWISRTDTSLDISELPPPSELDAEVLAMFLGCGAEFGPFDLTLGERSFYTGVSRLSHGSLLHRMNWAAPLRRMQPEWIEAPEAQVRSEAARELARNALDAHLGRALSKGKVAVEASGGIDSGIVLARARKLTGDREQVFGIAASYPYQEFSFEAGYRARLAQHLDADIHEVDEPSLPFDAVQHVEYHSHPAWLSGSWKQTNDLTVLARERGADTLLSGHGGDRLFLSHPGGTTSLPDTTSLALPSWMSGELARGVREARQACRTTFGQSWQASGFEPGWLISHVSAGAGSFSRYSGLLSRPFIAALRQIWLSGPLPATGGQKPLARWLFEEDLPPQLWDRKGKVDHLGLSYRGAIRNAEPLLALANDNPDLLRKAGVRLKPFARAVAGFVDGQDVGSRYLNGVLSFLVWSHSLQHSPRPTCELAWVSDQKVQGS